jgi:hypothetical protein
MYRRLVVVDTKNASIPHAHSLNPAHLDFVVNETLYWDSGPDSASGLDDPGGTVVVSY